MLRPRSRAPAAAKVVAVLNSGCLSPSCLHKEMQSTPSSTQGRPAALLVVRGAIPSTSVVSGLAGDEPWVNSGELTRV